MSAETVQLGILSLCHQYSVWHCLINCARPARRSAAPARIAVPVDGAAECTAPAARHIAVPITLLLPQAARRVAVPTDLPPVQAARSTVVPLGVDERYASRCAPCFLMAPLHLLLDSLLTKVSARTNQRALAPGSARVRGPRVQHWRASLTESLREARCSRSLRLAASCERPSTCCRTAMMR